jgi:glycosyltransferase involved in cell wall biosynthesis
MGDFMSLSERILSESSGAPSAPLRMAWKTRRVLVVSFDFPPRRTSAVYRMTGLTRSLPQLGWQPTVLTIRTDMGKQEPKLVEKLPAGVRVVRTKYFRIDRWEQRTHKAIQDAGGLRSKPDSGQPGRDRYVRSFGKLLRSTLYFPDETVGWVPHGLLGAISLHRREPFDAVYTTSPPRAASVIGLFLKIICGIPWIYEYMDPWYPPEGRMRTRAEHWLQAQLLHKADRVVVMVPQHAEELSRSFAVPAEKLVVVRNGFFEEDFDSLESSNQDSWEPGYCHLSHFGTIYPENAGKFFPALAELLRESPELKKRLRVNIGGHPSEDVLCWANEADLKEVIRLHGFTPDRRDVLRMMRASDCLLLFWGRPDFSRLAVAGKTYDYLRVGRPILAVTCEGGVQELVEQAQAGQVVAPQDTEAIKRAIRHLIRDKENGGSKSGPWRPEFVAQFCWDRQAETLARAFAEAVTNGR